MIKNIGREAQDDVDALLPQQVPERNKLGQLTTHVLCHSRKPDCGLVDEYDTTATG